MKKLISILAACALMAGLAACGGGASSSKPAEQKSSSTAASVASETPNQSSGGSLRVALWDKNQEVAITPILKEWAAANGVEIQVEVTPWDQYWTMLEAAATGEDMPDVFWMHNNQVRRYAENDLLMDLSDKISSSSNIDMSQFPEDIANIYNIDGKQYAIPKDMDTIALWYNKTMFDEAKVEYPNENWNWDDLKNAAQKLTKKDGSQYGFVASARDNQSGYYNFIYQNGGIVINDSKTEGGWTDPKTIEALEFYKSFVEEGLSPDATITSENEVYALLEAGTAAMGLQGSWMMGELGNNDYVINNFDCAVMPAGPTGTRATIYNGLGWSAAANTKNPDTAWALLEYLGGEEAQVKMGDTSIYNISAHSAGQTAWANSDERFNLKAYTDQVQYGVPYPSSKNTVVWAAINKEKVAELLTLNKSTAEICEEIQTETNKALAEEQ